MDIFRKAKTMPLFSFAFAGLRHLLYDSYFLKWGNVQRNFTFFLFIDLIVVALNLHTRTNVCTLVVQWLTLRMEPITIFNWVRRFLGLQLQAMNTFSRISTLLPISWLKWYGNQASDFIECERNHMWYMMEYEDRVEELV